MKIKRLYEKPSMKVYDLRQQPQLLAGSSSADLSGAGVDNGEDYLEW